MQTLMESYTGKILVGISLRLIVGARRFKRRGVGGLQHFRYYLIGILVLAIEEALKWIGNVLIIWGLLGLIFT